MSKQVFVGNIPYTASDDDLRKAFESQNIPVEDARVLKEGDRSRGFGFVSVADSMTAEAVIEKMTGFKLLGRNIRVEHATPRKSRQSQN